ncbi:MAG: hypothetical protein ACXIUZ_02000 [Lysobacteraceae bacterium]
MSDLLSPMTTLDAVNSMLGSIGQSPVNTLDVAGIRDVSIARMHLENASRDVQTKGWTFNTDTQFPMAPDELGEIAVPANVLDIFVEDRSLDVVVRTKDGRRCLYDRARHSFTFDRPLKCWVAWLFSFEELPQAARTYIAHRAGRVFQTNVVGSELLYRFTKEQEVEAYALLKRTETRNKRTNMMSGPSYTNQIFHRRRNP